MKKLLLIVGVIVAAVALVVVAPPSAPAFYGYGMVASYGAYYPGYCGYGYPVYGYGYTAGRRASRGAAYGGPSWYGVMPYWGYSIGYRK